MKTIGKYYAVAVAAIMTIGSIAFVSCNKEVSTTATNFEYSTKTSLSRAEIKAMTEEIAQFHDYEIRHLIENHDLLNTDVTCNNDIEYLAYIISEDIDSYNFSFINNALYPNDDYTNAVQTAYDICFNDKSDLTDFIDTEEASGIGLNVANIQQCFVLIDTALSESYSLSETIGSFKSIYENMTSIILDTMASDIDYFIVQLYSDLLISTFCTWADIQEETDNSKTNIFKKIAKVWRDMPPESKADICGGVAGAAIGALEGIPGSVPGIVLNGVREGLKTAIISSAAASATR